ncbi:hypothetical protein Ahy_B09g094687 isoform B [Arachis hypogaea]|uniref:Protein kinase domain-containing protein n=1 Tax=Arachis hypogaea TaxID=3818 RepID=A0A444XBX6_ARAHY|nr:hypothetical protein Ahy_B09g094687 isoform B [Arachis hypogaea]
MALWLCCGNGKKRGKEHATWRVFSLKELQSATNNFNYDNKLGEGGFGSVYWGQLWDGSQVRTTFFSLLLLLFSLLLLFCQKVHAICAFLLW